MNRFRFRRSLLFPFALLVATLLTAAAAIPLGHDTRVGVWADDGSVVGDGEIEGSVLDLDVLGGFEGPVGVGFRNDAGETERFAGFVNADGGLTLEVEGRTVSLEDFLAERGLSLVTEAEDGFDQDRDPLLPDEDEGDEDHEGDEDAEDDDEDEDDEDDDDDEDEDDDDEDEDDDDEDDEDDDDD